MQATAWAMSRARVRPEGRRLGQQPVIEAGGIEIPCRFVEDDDNRRLHALDQRRVVAPVAGEPRGRPTLGVELVERRQSRLRAARAAFVVRGRG